ncbi:MAG: ABC transporter ATP-binding protein [Ruminococcus sp.]|nr:ABC transporter ATP-binding protein [Ruminococcus sp.]
MLKLFRYLRHYKLQSILGPLFKLTEACFELAVPLVMANIIDVGIANEDSDYIIGKGIVLVLLGVLGLAASLTAQFFAARASLGFGTELRRDLFRHINTLSHKEIDSLGSSTLVSRMTVDINQAQTGINMLLRLFLRSPFIVIGAVIMAFSVSVKLTLIFLVASPLLALVIFFVMKKTVPMYKRIQKKLDRTTLMVGENISGVRVIRAFSRQEDERKAFEENSGELLDLQLKAGRISALTNPCTYVIVYIAIIAIIWFGGVNVDAGSITQGELIALISYMNQILLALLAVAILVTSLTKAQASAVRINEVFAVQSTLTDDGCTEQDITASDIAVEFKNVSFSYHENGENAVKDISFSVKNGETVGVIGGTGCGKSTLVSLIPRFYDCSGGGVSVFGNNVKAYPFKQLRGMIGYVPQKAELFRGTVEENLRYRAKDASGEDIIKALKTAQAYDFVMADPEGLDRMITAGGKNLSGGQRQRLTIARALVGEPKILILDDSASALDLATDAALRRALREKKGEMTVFIVSQRISSIRHADKILVLDDGELVGTGTHEQLLDSCPLYNEICRSQQYSDPVGKGAVSDEK